jgi:hypothetical protein
MNRTLIKHLSQMFRTTAFIVAALISIGAFATVKTPSNHFLQLRDAFDKATTTAQKQQLLKEMSTTGTFQGMMFSAKYLDDKALGKTAAKTVIDIATRHIEYNGANTRAIVEHAKKYVSGADKKRAEAYLLIMPKAEKGFVKIFNERDLSGWKGLVKNPIERSKMTAEELQSAQVKADIQMRKDWQVIDGLLTYVGTGFDNICTTKQYKDFEMLVDWKLDASGKEPDAGIYLRGTPQVQIWDTARVNVGAQVGSGGLYNNQKYESHPSKIADNATGQWNTFLIRMVGDCVTVYLNGEKVVDNVVLENYWDRSKPIFPMEQLELQAHGSRVYYRDIYVKEL